MHGDGPREPVLPGGECLTATKDLRFRVHAIAHDCLVVFRQFDRIGDEGDDVPPDELPAPVPLEREPDRKPFDGRGTDRGWKGMSKRDS